MAWKMRRGPCAWSRRGAGAEIYQSGARRIGIFANVIQPQIAASRRAGPARPAEENLHLERRDPFPPLQEMRVHQVRSCSDKRTRTHAHTHTAPRRSIFTPFLLRLGSRKLLLCLFLCCCCFFIYLHRCLRMLTATTLKNDSA